MTKKRPAPRIRCAECQKVIGTTADAHRVDDEWLRRVLADTGTTMSGHIVCKRCRDRHIDKPCCDIGEHVRPSGLDDDALRAASLKYVPGHLFTQLGRIDMDMATHYIGPATQRAAVILDPVSGIEQGARPSLEAIAADPQYEPRLRDGITAVLKSTR
ncbi:hypothetical protein [Flexivirga meconopsidis]|uniref:hypothetical protein n=1 Tax=Flexivirga meconopsidis TaxID=2977121 RepID=UPI00223FD3DF|nr:hypothetical protein [Flexivirga meconopsidis]